MHFVLAVVAFAVVTIVLVAIFLKGFMADSGARGFAHALYKAEGIYWAAFCAAGIVLSVLAHIPSIAYRFRPDNFWMTLMPLTSIFAFALAGFAVHKASCALYVRRP